MKLLVLSCFLLSCSVEMVFAATHVVRPDGTGDFPTIQAAIDAASPGDVIQLTAGTFSGDGNRDISFLGKPITVTSMSGEATACIIDCDASSADRHRAFSFENSEGPASVLEKVTLKNGWAEDGGGMNIDEGCSPTIRDCIIENNTAEYPGNGYGGGIYCSGSPLITNCTVQDNIAGNRGGGIMTRAEDGAVIEGCIIMNNSAEDGGGIHCRMNTSIRGCLIVANHAIWGDAYGGGISCRFHYGTIENCTLIANEATGSNSNGAGITFIGDGPSVERCIVADCIGGGAFGWGGAVGTSSPSISCCDIWNNNAGTGSALLAGMIDGGGNFAENPAFCNPDGDDYTLAEGSPCLPGNHPDEAQCGLVGAFGLGCIEVPVKQSTWGRIKTIWARQ
jgi:hypothetical protein